MNKNPINTNELNSRNGYRINEPTVENEYSALKISETMQGTGDMGELYPVFWRELLPTQKIHVRTEIAMQFNRMNVNLFQRLFGKMYYWAVPLRILEEGWEEFIMGGVDGKSQIKHPTHSYNSMLHGKTNLEGTLIDYFGLPIQKPGPDDIEINSFPIRAYNMCYNWGIRNIDTEPTPVNIDSIEIQKDLKPFDYRTKMRVYQQRGVVPTINISDAGQTLKHAFDIATTVPEDAGLNNKKGQNIYVETKNGDHLGHVMSDIGQAMVRTYTEMPLFTVENIGGTGQNDLRFSVNKPSLMHEGHYDGASGLFTPNGQIDNAYQRDRHIGAITVKVADHTLDNLGINLNDFIVAMNIQRYQINNARIKQNYSDWISARYRIHPQDSRMQLPEFLGTDYFNVTVDLITQTAPEVKGSSDETKLGHIQGQGWGSGQVGSEYEAKEHTIIIGMMVVMPDNNYEGGVGKEWQKETKFDYATPELANAPDVPVRLKELVLTGKKSLDEKVLGYQEIYGEYKTALNKVTGKFRPSLKVNGMKEFTLAEWYDPTDEANLPVLNNKLLKSNPDKGRIMSYPNQPTFMYFARNEIRTSLPLPLQSAPGEQRII